MTSNFDFSVINGSKEDMIMYLMSQQKYLREDNEMLNETIDRLKQENKMLKNQNTNLKWSIVEFRPASIMFFPELQVKENNVKENNDDENT